MPTYGRPEYLAEALNSIQGQTLLDFECLVVDDGSPDPVVLPIDDDRFQLIRRSPNGGPASARNTGLRVARGKYVAFLDDDDAYLPGHLALAMVSLNRAPLVICGMGRLDSTDVTYPDFEGIVHDRILNSTTPHLGAVTVERQRCLEFDERFIACEDLDWWLRMTKDVPVASTRDMSWCWRSHQGVRLHHGSQARIDGSLLLLAEHTAYFKTHRRAAGFRWLRIAALAAEVGHRRLMLSATRRAILLDPRPTTVARAVKRLLPRTKPSSSV